MYKTLLTILILFGVLANSALLGQEDRTSLNNLKNKSFILKNKEIVLDSFSILASSVTLKINGTPVHNDQFDIANNTVYISDSLFTAHTGDTLNATFRTFPFNFEKKFSHLDSTMMKSKDKAIYIGYDYRPYAEDNTEDLISAKGLNYNGSFSRGFSVGNSQSLVLNSNFNLQLAGDLGNGLKVVAAISDDNIPIQPEGNTQLLQEFDKVFIKVSKDNTSAIAGDYELSKPKGYFINYFKKLKGLSLENTSKISDNLNLRTKASFAVTKGKFSRQTIDNQEGNQGPYKLVGNDGERFLIVLSGSEKVYYDGVLLQRGYENDYVIDYNRAEITFTPSRIVTKDSRIIIEFEYSVENYLRTLYTLNTSLKTKKSELYFNFYNEQDSKNATGTVTLDSIDIFTLTNSGDDPNNALRSGIRIAENPDLESGQIFYELRNGILVYSTNTDSILYTATFSEVLDGSGTYEIDQEIGVNGRVYTYVGENGKYIPEVVLIAPEKRQIMSLGGSHNIGKNTFVAGELSLSNTDENRFSTIDDNDNTGLAGFFEFQNKVKLKTGTKWELTSSIKYEQLSKNFDVLNPYRDPEFTRNWNISTNDEEAGEQFFTGKIELKNPDITSVTYEFNSYKRESSYSGTKQIATINLRSKGFELTGYGNILLTEGNGEKTSFFRPKLDISQTIQKLKSLKIGFSAEVEDNDRRSLLDESELLSTSFYYDKWSAYLTNSETSTFSYKLTYSRRNDKLPEDNSLKAVSHSDEFDFSGSWKTGSTSSLAWNVAYRDLKVADPNLSPAEAKKTILGKLDYNWAAFNGAIKSLSSVNALSGQEPKQEFVYIRLANGAEGDFIEQYDAENDITYFVPATNNVIGTHIRRAVFNNEFVSTNNQGINQSLRLEPKKFWSNSKPTSRLAKLVSKLSTNSNLRINQKVRDEVGKTNTPFLSFNFNDTSLVSYTALINNTLYINKGNPTFDIQLGRQDNKTKILQISGFEARGLEKYFARLRWNVRNNFDIILNAETGQKTSDSELFDSRDSDISQYNLKPEISYRPKNNIRLSLKYEFVDRQQKIRDMESAVSNDFTIQVDYRKASTESLTTSFSFVNVKYDGEANTPIEYDLLEGLKDGKNFLLSINYIRRLAGNIDLNLSYEGRKTGVSDMVHIGRMQVKATF